MGTVKKSEIADTLQKLGYIAREEELCALKSLLHPAINGGMKACLLEGAPGTGKTMLSKVFAQMEGAKYLYTLLHSWSDDQELFQGIDIASAITGDAENVRQDGVLLAAARASLQSKVVVCLDEIDKAPPKVEALLLDFLQEGRVPTAPGQYLQARKENICVFITSNAQRELSDAFKRRCRRVQMLCLEPQAEAKLLASLLPQTPKGWITLIVRILTEIRKTGESFPSLQEARNCLLELEWAETSNDVTQALRGWLQKSEVEETIIKNLSPALWGEIKKGRV